MTGENVTYPDKARRAALAVIRRGGTLQQAAIAAAQHADEPTLNTVRKWALDARAPLARRMSTAARRVTRQRVRGILRGGIVSVADAAEILGVSTSTIYRRLRG